MLALMLHLRGAMLTPCRNNLAQDGGHRASLMQREPTALALSFYSSICLSVAASCTNTYPSSRSLHRRHLVIFPGFFPPSSVFQAPHKKKVLSFRRVFCLSDTRARSRPLALSFSLCLPPPAGLFTSSSSPSRPSCSHTSLQPRRERGSEGIKREE